MIEIKNSVVKKQKSFFNQCVFHPTDAVEDPWGKRILDRMSRDGAIDTIRIYAMLEDIVYCGEDGELSYDFRLNDLRLDYLVERGYGLVIAYAGMPDSIAKSDNGKSTAAKNKTRYKGKMWNTNSTADYKAWEDVCYEYTKHIIERYGIDVVSSWRVHCFNEPDITMFFLSEIDEKKFVKERCEEYLRMYEAFVKGVRRASSEVRVGGPALAYVTEFLEQFLNGVKERDLDLDYISIHTYGTSPMLLNLGEEKLSVDLLMKKIGKRFEVIKRCGFGDTPLVIDEWGASSHGFFNSEECKVLMFRESEILSAYFVRFVYELIHSEFPIENLMICLSGQHEMVEDFSGFRNFFTLNFIAKPIYNANILLSKLGENLLDFCTDKNEISVIPTRGDNGEYAVAAVYATEHFDGDLPPIAETVVFDEDISGKSVTVWCIDKEHTNPFRLYQKMGITQPTADEINLLRKEGMMHPVCDFVAKNSFIEIKMSANSVILITVEG